MAKLKTHIDPHSDEFADNSRAMRLLIDDFRENLQTIGGGEATALAVELV